MGSDNGWSGMACVALALIVCGGAAVWARRLGPRAAAGAVQVIGRVSLSPKHSVYLLRVGRRVLVLGAGPQGPPALITELDEVPHDPPAAEQGAES
jgi:flagellar biogenesis protein FliO